MILGPDDPAEVLARSSSARGEILLRRRGSGDDVVYELVVNGAFAMDSTETHTERQLGDVAFETTSGGRVLIGGLGLGYTVWEVLQHRVSGVDVVEIEEALLGWARRGLTPTLARVAADPRVALHAGDVVDVLARPGLEPSGPWQAILLDVDNGPDFLIHAGNASLYGEEVLRSAVAQLTPAGTLAIWCQGPAPELLDTLRRIDPKAEERDFSVQRGERRFRYVIYTLHRPITDSRPETQE